MSQGTRRKFSAEDKAAILRQHLVDKPSVPVSDVCDEYEIQPSASPVKPRNRSPVLGCRCNFRRR